MTSDITDVELHASNQYKVIYHGLKRFKPSVNVKNGQLKITQTSNGVSYNIKEGNTVAIYLPNYKISILIFLMAISMLMARFKQKMSNFTVTMVMSTLTI